jgi:hypothetical protein
MELQIFRNTTEIDHILGTELEWRNLKGRKSRFAGGNPNEPGPRSFDVILTEADAKILYDLGWRMKLKGRYKHGDTSDTKWQDMDGFDDDRFAEKKYSIKINVSYDYPCYIYRIVEGSNTKRLMTPDATDPSKNLAMLDDETISFVDMQVRTSRSKRDGLITAYLEWAYFNVVSRSSAADRYSMMATEGEEESMEDLDDEQ